MLRVSVIVHVQFITFKTFHYYVAVSTEISHEATPSPSDQLPTLSMDSNVVIVASSIVSGVLLFLVILICVAFLISMAVLYKQRRQTKGNKKIEILS